MLGLIVQEPWVSMILNGRKPWEIRSRDTKVRGRIWIIRKGSGLIIGSARLHESFQVTKRQLLANTKKHRTPRKKVLAMFRRGSSYRKPWAWVLKDPKPLPHPKSYKHPNGAIVWVRLND